MRKLIKLLAAAGMLAGLLAFAPTAQASHTAHRPMPTPKVVTDVEGTCLVNGSVDLSPGLSSTPSHGHYSFQQTSLVCVSATEPAANDTFNVTTPALTANPNGSDGENLVSGVHGEDCEQGWSAEGGTITATSSGGDVYTGEVEFVRVGAAVHAWGEMSDGSTNIEFSAELVFVPTNGDCVLTPVTSASLTGTAVLEVN